MFAQLPMSLIPDKLPMPGRRRIATLEETTVPKPCPETETPPPPIVPEETDGDAVEITQNVAADPTITTEEGSGVRSDVLVIETATQSDMEQRMTLRQLRDMCAEMNLPVMGKKAEVVSRIIEERERSKGD